MSTPVEESWQSHRVYFWPGDGERKLRFMWTCDNYLFGEATLLLDDVEVVEEFPCYYNGLC
jgi:hypothetical protein